MTSIDTILRDLFSAPTAPYREAWVMKKIEAHLKRLNSPYVTDSAGNIVAGVSNLKELKSTRRVALVAHTDHPGFHIIKRLKRNRALAQWHGGCPPVMKDAPLAIYHPSYPGVKIKGRCLNRLVDRDKHSRFEIQFAANTPFDIGAMCFGAFDYPGYKRSKSKIISRAADDLAGVAIALATLERLNHLERKSFLAIFTRAEEVGFIGALGLIFGKYLGPQVQVISLEASSQRQGARVGRGPIVRLGDRRTLFDTELISQIDAAARNIRHQRRIMDGGSCEATAFNLFGTRAAGMAVPLGNYHNQKPNGKPGPEFIDLKDVEGAVAICVQFYKSFKTITPYEKLRRDLKSSFKKSRKLLKGELPFEF